MMHVILMVENDEHAGRIADALTCRHVEVLRSRPCYANYVKTLQYLPDAIIMEMPEKNHPQLHYIQMLKQHKAASKIPICCFGRALHPSVKEGLARIGVDSYLEYGIDPAPLLDQLRILERSPDKKQVPHFAKKMKGGEDLRGLLGRGITRGEKAQVVAGRISGMMAFPFTVSRVVQMSGDSRSGAADLARIIESDPVVSANILRLCNSVAFAAKHRRVGTVHEAITRIGFAETRRAVMSMGVMNMFDTHAQNLGFNRLDFWLHCLATALIAEKLASAFSVGPGDAFLTGLLHDFGIIVLDEYFPDAFAETLRITTDRAAHFIDAEEELFGSTHGEIVEALFEEWKMSWTITQAVAACTAASRGRQVPWAGPGMLGLAAAAANTIAKSMALGASCDQFVSHSVLRDLGGAFAQPLVDVEFERGIRAGLLRYREFLKIDNDNSGGVKHKGEPGDGAVIGIADLCNCPFVPAEAYLRTLGYRVERLRDASRAGSCDAVVAVAGRTTRADELASLCTVRGCSSPFSSGIRGFIPLLILAEDIDILKPFGGMEHVSCMAWSFDLRQLETNIAQVMRGRRIAADRL